MCSSDHEFIRRTISPSRPQGGNPVGDGSFNVVKSIANHYDVVAVQHLFREYISDKIGFVITAAVLTGAEDSHEARRKTEMIEFDFRQAFTFRGGDVQLEPPRLKLLQDATHTIVDGTLIYATCSLMLTKGIKRRLGTVIVIQS